jgi:hypothetical protein
MLGTALAIVPEFQLAGTVLLWGSLPLSVLSLKEKMVVSPASRALVFASDLFSDSNIRSLVDVEKKYEVIACVSHDENKKGAARHFGDVIDGVVVLDNDRLEEAEFDRLNATVLYIGSDADRDKIDVKLVERGVVKILPKST